MIKLIDVYIVKRRIIFPLLFVWGLPKLYHIITINIIILISFIQGRRQVLRLPNEPPVKSPPQIAHRDITSARDSNRTHRLLQFGIADHGFTPQQIQVGQVFDSLNRFLAGRFLNVSMRICTNLSFQARTSSLSLCKMRK